MADFIEKEVVVIEPPTTKTWMGQNGPGGVTTVVVEYQDGNYKRQVALEHRKNYEQFGRLQVGQRLKVKYDVTSRKWQDKWFTSANCFAWEPIGAQQPSYTQSQDAPF